VTAVDCAKPMVAAHAAAAVGCAFDFDLDLMLARRALSSGVVSTSLNSARKRLGLVWKRRQRLGRN
jgi:hypothetical protein